jgi:hypothetical protein
MRIVLATQHAHRAFIPLALRYLKASVAGRGCCAADDIALFEFDNDASADAIAGAVVDAHSDLVGPSCYVWNIKTTMAAARADVLRAHPFRPVRTPAEFYFEFGAREFAAAAARIRSATRTTSTMAVIP